jgi:DNA (cytosine-5)-methyltransferase 1
MKTVELFCGIGGFRLAADARAFTTVWANDISELACSVYRDRFGLGELHQGEIRELLNTIPNHELLTAGFPCQPFSSAGKKRGIEDPRGTLFQVIVDVLRKSQPEFFILENVKRLLTMDLGSHFATILASLAELDYLIEWRLLNAMHFGLPQNRQRVFILGSRRHRYRPQQPWIKLATVDELKRLDDETLQDLREPDTWLLIENHRTAFSNWGLAQGGRFLDADLADFSQKSPPTLLKSVLQEDVQTEFDFTATTLKWLSDNTPVNRLIQGVEILSNQGGGARMGYTIFGTNGVSPTLTSSTSRHYERYKIGERYRRLTNVEYARIQGFPDDHCAVASVYDQYVLFGNAVPPKMAGWVIDQLSKQSIDEKVLSGLGSQLRLFSGSF